MLFLLDTNAFSDVMENHPRVVGRLRRVSASDRVVICTIVRGEILFGIERLPPGKRRANLERTAGHVFADLRCESPDADVADMFSRLKRECQAAGSSVADNDLWIAATAVSLDATLVTRDADLSRVPGLLLEDWST